MHLPSVNHKPFLKFFFPLVLSSSHLDRAHVKSALVSAPAHYHLVEHTCGSVAFLGDGTPTADAGPAHSPQVLERPGSVVVLVSPQLNAADIAEAFANVCEAHADPKARAVALKMKLRELSVDERFSFVLLDLATARVFCASTALSSPLALGHAPDGTSDQTFSSHARVSFFPGGEVLSTPNLAEFLFRRLRTSASTHPTIPPLDALSSFRLDRHAPGDVHALGSARGDVLAPPMGEWVLHLHIRQSPRRGTKADAPVRRVTGRDGCASDAGAQRLARHGPLALALAERLLHDVQRVRHVGSDRRGERGAVPPSCWTLCVRAAVPAAVRVQRVLAQRGDESGGGAPRDCRDGSRGRLGSLRVGGQRRRHAGEVHQEEPGAGVADVEQPELGRQDGVFIGEAVHKDRFP